MYQAILEGCSGSEWSGPIWPYMLTIHRTVMIPLTMVPRRGYQQCRVNMTTLTRRMNIESTDIATLKEVKACDHTKGIFGIGLWFAYAYNISVGLELKPFIPPTFQSLVRKRLGSAIPNSANPATVPASSSIIKTIRTLGSFHDLRIYGMVNIVLADLLGQPSSYR